MGGITLALYLNKKTGLTWQVDDKKLAERLNKDEDFEIVQPEVKKPEPKQPIIQVAKEEKPNNKK